MITTTLRAIALICMLANLAEADCGDVTGDGEVTSKDALRTLRRAVGQDVDMDCSQAEPVVNALAFTNRISCNSSDPHAKLTWSEHPSLEWQTNLMTKYPPLASPYQRIDDL